MRDIENLGLVLAQLGGVIGLILGAAFWRIDDFAEGLTTALRLERLAQLHASDSITRTGVRLAIGRGLLTFIVAGFFLLAIAAVLDAASLASHLLKPPGTYGRVLLNRLYHDLLVSVGETVLYTFVILGLCFTDVVLAAIGRNYWVKLNDFSCYPNLPDELGMRGKEIKNAEQLWFERRRREQTCGKGRGSEEWLYSWRGFHEAVIANRLYFSASLNRSRNELRGK